MTDIKCYDKRMTKARSLDFPVTKFRKKTANIYYILYNIEANW